MFAWARSGAVVFFTALAEVGLSGQRAEQSRATAAACAGVLVRDVVVFSVCWYVRVRWVVVVVVQQW